MAAQRNIPSYFSNIVCEKLIFAEFFSKGLVYQDILKEL